MSNLKDLRVNGKSMTSALHGNYIEFSFLTFPKLFHTVCLLFVKSFNFKNIFQTEYEKKKKKKSKPATAIYVYGDQYKKLLFWNSNRSKKSSKIELNLDIELWFINIIKPLPQIYSLNKTFLYALHLFVRDSPYFVPFCFILWLFI